MATSGRYGPDDSVSRDQLAPATVVQRRTEPVTSGRHRGTFDTRVPCCDRWARVQHNDSDAFSLVACTPCGLVYEVDLVDEHSGRWDDQPSYLAHLTDDTDPRYRRDRSHADRQLHHERPTTDHPAHRDRRRHREHPRRTDQHDGRAVTAAQILPALGGNPNVLITAQDHRSGALVTVRLKARTGPSGFAHTERVS